MAISDKHSSLKTHVGPLKALFAYSEDAEFRQICDLNIFQADFLVMLSSGVSYLRFWYEQSQVRWYKLIRLELFFWW